MDDRTRALAEKLWRYHQLNHQLSRADVILVLCSHDKGVAARSGPPRQLAYRAVRLSARGDGTDRPAAVRRRAAAGEA